MTPQLPIPDARIRDFCRRHHVRSLALFGSVLREDFGPDSDIDVLVDFEPDAPVSLLEIVDMQDELEALLERSVDLVDLKGLRNPFRRDEILRTRQIIYAA